jgi:hypothetical protein
MNNHDRTRRPSLAKSTVTGTDPIKQQLFARFSLFLETRYLTIRNVLPILFDMGKKRPKVSDQIRAAIDAAGVTRYRISKDTGISESMLSRFMGGSRGLSMEALDTLGEYLDLEVVRRKTPKGR